MCVVPTTFFQLRSLLAVLAATIAFVIRPMLPSIVLDPTHIVRIYKRSAVGQQELPLTHTHTHTHIHTHTVLDTNNNFKFGVHVASV